MDSQVTLVNRDPLVLVLSQDNVKETELIRRRDSRNLYKVVSDESLLTLKTSVYRVGSDVPIAVIETKNICGQDKITLRDGARRNITDWISGYSIFGSFPMTFENQGKRYLWKKNHVQQLGLFNDYDTDNPIAWFERSKLRVMDGVLKSFPASLTLLNEAKEMQDIVVVSLLVVEDRIRGDFRPGRYRKSI